jgi:hypothetical protein
MTYEEQVEMNRLATVTSYVVVGFAAVFCVGCVGLTAIIWSIVFFDSDVYLVLDNFGGWLGRFGGKQTSTERAERRYLQTYNSRIQFGSWF